MAGLYRSVGGFALSIAFVGSCCVRAADAADAAPAVKLTQESNHIHVDIGGAPFTDYWFGERTDRPYTRPFFFPVNASDGVCVTSDQYTVPKGDHPHHQSLWVSHMSVNGVDHWSLLAKPTPAKQRHIKFEKAEGDTLIEALDWEAQDFKTILLHEKRTMRFIPLPDGSRAIDLTVALTPADGKVVLGDVKDAGLCSVRVNTQISGTTKNPAKDELITNSLGATGEPACWGQPADWCDESGTIDGKPYGVAIFDHPSNARHPTRWHVRQYGLMTANPFARHEFDKNIPEHTGDFPIEPGTTVTFKYRVIIHSGNAASAKLDEKYKAFSAE